MRYHFFLHYGWFFQNLEKDFIPILLHTTVCTKNQNSSFFKPKIRGLYTRAISDQERVIMARVRYIEVFSRIKSLNARYTQRGHFETLTHLPHVYRFQNFSVSKETIDRLPEEPFSPTICSKVPISL